MQLTLLNFLIGFFLMNAMPHWIMGLTKTRFLSAFGFTPQANIVYSFLNTAIALSLFVWGYGTEALLSNGVFVGAAAMLLIYYLTGKFFVDFFHNNYKEIA